MTNDAWADKDGRTRFRPDLVLLPLDDELVLFSEQVQCLVGLNASAAVVFRHLQKGAAAPELARSLAREGLAPLDEAERWVTATLDALASQGMIAEGPAPAPPSVRTLEEDQRSAALRIAGVPPLVPFEPEAERRYRLLETCALVRFSHAGQVRMVDAVLGHLATDDDAVPTIVIDIKGRVMNNGHLRSAIYRDGSTVGWARRLSYLGPLVKATLWQSAVNAHDFLFYIHAGVVGAGESCILLPAAAGSGKSSLTAALAHAGFRYYSDEVALIERTTFRVPPMSLAICVKSTGWDLMARYYPDLPALPIHRREDNKVVRYIAPPAGAAQQQPAPVSHIIFPRHDKDAATELKPIPRSEALSRLMGECLALRQRLDLNNVGELVRWIAGIDCYALTFSSLDQATALVAQVAARGKL
jgi:hypothetical protein